MHMPGQKCPCALDLCISLYDRRRAGEDSHRLFKCAPFDSCGSSPQVEVVSQSIRISDELADAAQRQARLFHRSPPQQIEYWAAIGRVMEAGLSFPATEKVARAVGPEQIEAALKEVGTPEGIERAQAVIRQTSANIVSD
jgi:hypothetical protein